MIFHVLIYIIFFSNCQCRCCLFTYNLTSLLFPSRLNDENDPRSPIVCRRLTARDRSVDKVLGERDGVYTLSSGEYDVGMLGEVEEGRGCTGWWDVTAGGVGVGVDRSSLSQGMSEF